MSEARDRVYSIANQYAHEIAERHTRRKLDRSNIAIEAGSVEDDRLHEALNMVEEDEAHNIAVLIRAESDGCPMEIGCVACVTRITLADRIDPFELVDESWCYKTTGDPVTRWNV